ncbi:hypothetical protein L204_102363 [Cryptococcus depauperatus]|nr:hypothetical protein L204_05932 [Cryptococcus depauperatus CBS 7855]
MSCLVSLGFNTSTQLFKTSLSWTTKSGVLFGPNCQVYSPPMVLVEAVNLLFNKIKTAVHESEGLISLGTSDVVLVSTSNYHPEYHILFHLAMIALLTDKNKIAFWWLLPDVVISLTQLMKFSNTPPTLLLDLYSKLSQPSVSPSSLDIRQEIRSFLESQLLNYCSRSSAILDDSLTSYDPSSPNDDANLLRVTRVYAAGGTSANKTIINLMADVLCTNVCKNVEYNDRK